MGEPIPIEIRADVFVWIQGIPHDLTKEEADKIARVVKALAGCVPSGHHARAAAARAASLPPERRTEIARQAANARWGK